MSAGADSNLSTNSQSRKRSYEINETATALSGDEPVGSIRISAGGSPVSVTETLHCTDREPATSHDIENRLSTWRIADPGAALPARSTTTFAF